MTSDIFNPANYSFSMFAVPTLVTAITTLALGFVVLIGERQSRVSVSFFVMTLTASVWLSGYSVMYCARIETVGAFWAFIGQVGISFIPAAVYHFTVGALEIYRQYKSRVWLTWLVSIAFFATVLWSGAFLDGVYSYWWGFYPKYQWLSIPFLGFFFGMMAFSLHHYWVEYRTAPQGSRKLRSSALFKAFCIAYLGSFDYLPAFGFPLYPWGHIPVLGFIALTARAISRHRLIDITPAFAAKQIINAMDDALLILDNEGIVRVANGAACRLFARPESQLVGSPVRPLTCTLTSTDVGLDNLILSGSLRDFECALRPEQRGSAVVSVSSFVMHDASMQPIASVCLIRNITQQKTAEEEIRRHIERQTALYEINLATTSTLELRYVLEVLLDSLTRLVPKAATTIMLLSEDEQKLIKVASRGIDEDEWKSQQDCEDKASHPVLEKKEAFLVSDIRLHSDGLQSAYFAHNGFVAYVGVPLIAKGTVLGILSCYCRDHRPFTDEEVNFLRSIAGQAAAAIHNSQLYEQTKKQANELEKANEVKDEFLSVMSHELRTPLNVISGYTKLVQDGIFGEINAEQSKALDKVTRHANELLVMVNGIMDAAKIEAGAVIADCDEFPLAAFFDDLKPLYDYPLRKDVTLNWECPSSLPIMRTDRDKLKHILQNLINNALKFTEQGFVTLAVRYLEAPDKIEIAVSDTGPGIAPEDLPLIFERFRQLDSSKTRTHGGVGLGLHIVKIFVELLHGTVAAASEPGHGATFTVTLPRIFPGQGTVRTIRTANFEAPTES